MRDYKKFLVVDDDPDIIFLFTLVLKDLHTPFASFQNPVEAINYFKNNSNEVGLIITDYYMLEMNGLEMMRKIHQIRKVPFILMSSNLQSIQDSYSQLQINKIEKPIAIDRLFYIIQQYKVEISEHLSLEESAH